MLQNLMNVIKRYNLTQYDSELNKGTIGQNQGGNKMVITVHAGHNPDGKIACGAIGLIKESTEARNVKNSAISMLKSQGHIVYDCTVDNGTSQNDILKKICDKCNSYNADLNVSIHFNSGSNNKTGNGKTTGTEVYVYSATSKAYSYAKDIVDEIAKLGFKNRGVKINTSLYVLKHTTAPTLLVECCFVDDKDDTDLYNADKMAQAIVKGITGVASTITHPSGSGSNTSTSNSGGLYRVRKSWSDAGSQIGAFSSLDNAKAACKDGYSVFDSAGNVVYTKSSSNGTSSNNSSVSNNTKELIKIGQQHAINFTGVKIAVDGIVGSDTNEMKVRVLQRGLNLDYGNSIAEDGIVGTNTRKKLGSHYVQRGEKQYMVTVAEILMYLNGIDPDGLELPGVYGSGLTNAAKKKFGGNGQRISASNFLALV